MNYQGKLYGKIGKKYAELAVGTDYVDGLHNKIEILESKNAEYKNVLAGIQDPSMEQYATQQMAAVLEWAHEESFMLIDNEWVSPKVFYSGCAYTTAELIHLYKNSR